MDLTSNQLIIGIAEKSLVTEESEAPTVYMIPNENTDIQKGYYHGLYILLKFKKEDGVDRTEKQADMEADPYEEEMEDVRLNDKRQRHWRMVSRITTEGECRESDSAC